MKAQKKLVSFWPMKSLKAYCVTNFDTDGDGEISYAEALNIRTIHWWMTCIYHVFEKGSWSILPNLMALYCNDNKIKNSWIWAKNKKLEKVYC